MKQTCDNCIYQNRQWGDNPCRTCIPCDDERENWTWNGENEDKENNNVSISKH